MYYLRTMLAINLFSFLILIIACAEAYNKNIDLVNAFFLLALLSGHENIED